MNRVCVFAGSNVGARPEYGEAALALGDALLERRLGLVYGGARIGLMGVLADRVLAGGGEVIGVIPRSLADHEVAHAGLTELHLVTSMHERKALMASRADAFLALPGGWGTLEEWFEVLTWNQLGFHRKPCGLLNAGGYFDGLLTFLEHAVAERFVRREHAELIHTDARAGVLLDRLASQPVPAPGKWIDLDRA